MENYAIALKKEHNLAGFLASNNVHVSNWAASALPFVQIKQNRKVSLVALDFSDLQLSVHATTEDILAAAKDLGYKQPQPADALFLVAQSGDALQHMFYYVFLHAPIELPNWDAMIFAGEYRFNPYRKMLVAKFAGLKVPWNRYHRFVFRK